MSCFKSTQVGWNRHSKVCVGQVFPRLNVDRRLLKNVEGRGPVPGTSRNRGACSLPTSEYGPPYSIARRVYTLHFHQQELRPLVRWTPPVGRKAGLLYDAKYYVGVHGRKDVANYNRPTARSNQAVCQRHRSHRITTHARPADVLSAAIQQRPPAVRSQYER